MATASRFMASRTQRAAFLRKARLVAHLRVRGEHPPPEILVECTRLKEGIERAKHTFENFDERNPWIFQDSLQGRIYVLVDPDLTKNNPANRVKR